MVGDMKDIQRDLEVFWTCYESVSAIQAQMDVHRKHMSKHSDDLQKTLGNVQKDDKFIEKQLERLQEAKDVAITEILRTQETSTESAV